MVARPIQIEDIQAPASFVGLVDRLGPGVLHILYITSSHEGGSADYRLNNIQPALEHAVTKMKDPGPLIGYRFYEIRMFKSMNPEDYIASGPAELGELGLPVEIVESMTFPAVLVFEGSVKPGSVKHFTGECKKRLKEVIDGWSKVASRGSL